MLLKKAASRRFILRAALRELLMTGCVLKSVVRVHCEETCCCSWSQDSTAEEVASPKRALLIRLATQRECSVTRTSMRCIFAHYHPTFCTNLVRISALFFQYIPTFCTNFIQHFCTTSVTRLGSNDPFFTAFL